METSIKLAKKARLLFVKGFKLQARRLKNIGKSRRRSAVQSPDSRPSSTSLTDDTPQHHDAIDSGASKIVRVREGDMMRPAILPSKELFSEINTAVHDYQDMLAAEHEFNSRIDVWKEQYDLLQARIHQLEHEIEDSRASAIEGTTVDETDPLQGELEDLQQQKQNILNKRNAGRKALQNRYEKLRCGQFDLFHMLAELSETDSDKVLQIHDDPGERADTSHLEVIKGQQRQQAQPAGPVQENGGASYGGQVTPEHAKKAERMLRCIDFWATVVDQCQCCLYDRHERFQRLWQERNWAIERGEEVQTDEEFEVFQFQETQRLTRELIDAEAHFEEAKQAALDARIQPLGSDLESGFLDQDDDGYLESEEREMCEAIDHERIEHWIEETSDPEKPTGRAGHLPTGFDLSAFERQFEWKSKEVEVWESASMVAEGPSRRRIDKWREIADSQRNGLHEEAADGQSCQQLCGEGLEASSSWGKDLTAAMKSVGEE